MVKAVWNGVVIADSASTIILEGNHYFTPDSVRMDLLKPSQTTSYCGWKGTAIYYTLEVDGRTNEDCAWCYADPSSDASRIRGMIAFWKGIQTN